MVSKYIDLHTHSTASDGTLTPTELVQYALKKGLSAIALTDHDTTEGIPEAQKAAQGTSLSLIPGVELSTAWQSRDIHILGLNINVDDVHFQELLENFQKERDLRNQKMVRLLKEQGLQITWEELTAHFPKGVLTRAHFARFLLDTRQVHTLPEAFNRFLGDHAPCFVPREKVTPFQAVQMIHQGGGKAVLAHPLLYHLKPEQLGELVTQLARCGLDGIEAIYSTNQGMDESTLRRLARSHELFITGGSDFHGSNKPAIDLGSGRGNLKIPAELLQFL
ncbi:MAG: PHP domain-containing protein [Clostridiales bacterium]|nr:PHP domain-containing protein [Clostridiales bacterium]